MNQVVVIARLVANTGCYSEVYSAAKSLADSSRKEAGCISYKLYQSLEDDLEILIHEVWKDETALNDHKSMPHIADFKKAVASLVSVSVEKLERL